MTGTLGGISAIMLGTSLFVAGSAGAAICLRGVSLSPRLGPVAWGA